MQRQLDTLQAALAAKQSQLGDLERELQQAQSAVEGAAQRLAQLRLAGALAEQQGGEAVAAASAELEAVRSSLVSCQQQWQQAQADMASELQRLQVRASRAPGRDASAHM